MSESGETLNVGKAEELQPGERKIVEHNETSIGIFNIEGEYYAIENRCVHEGGPVCKGKIQGKLIAEYIKPGARIKETFSDTPVIACPWHGWEYELPSGKHIGVDDIYLNTYNTSVEDGNLLIHI